MGDGQLVLRRLLGARYDVTVRESRDELVQAIRDGPPVAAIVTDLWDSHGHPAAPAVKMARRIFPSVPIIVCCRLVPGAASEILALARAGINALALRGFDDVGAALSSLIANAATDCDASGILSAIRPFLRAHEVPIVEYCVLHARSKLTVTDVARALSLSRRTLSHRLETGRLHSAHSLIVWCRLLIAARLLQDSGRTVESIALSLQFGSAAAFRNMLRRRVGLSPVQLREQGGQPYLLKAFTRVLASRDAAARMRVRPGRARRRPSRMPRAKTGVRAMVS
jgi:AraC-like DNA-binding protein